LTITVTYFRNNLLLLRLNLLKQISTKLLKISRRPQGSRLNNLWFRFLKVRLSPPAKF